MSRPFHVQSLIVALLTLAVAIPLHAQTTRQTELSPADPLPPEISAINRQVFRLFQQGRNAEALPLAEDYLEKVRQLRGTNNADYSLALYNLAAQHTALGHYSEAERLYKEALEITRKISGEDHPDTAACLNNLAELYQETGDLAAAEPPYKQALAITRKALGEDALDTGRCMSSLGALYWEKGDFTSAEPLLKQALKIKKNRLGPNHPSTATTLDNLAHLYEDKGDITSAEPLAKEALAIRQMILGSTHPDTVASLSSLAGFYSSRGDYAEAKPLYEQALEATRANVGEHHPDTAWCLNNLGTVFLATGKYATAELLFKQAVVIDEKALGTENVGVAAPLSNLANLYKIKGDYAAAEPLFKRALSIRRAALGDEHPDTISSTDGLVMLHAVTGRAATALEESRTQWRASIKNRDRILAVGSEREQAAYIGNVFAGRSLLLLSLVCQFLPADPTAVRFAAEVILADMGAMLEAMARRQAAALDGADPALRPLYDQWRAASANLARASVAAMPPGVNRQERLAAVTNAAESAEKALAEASVRFASQKEQSAVGLTDVARTLPAGSALVEFAPYRSFRFDAKPGDRWGEWRYIAAVVRGGGEPGKEVVSLVQLGPAKEIEAAVERWRRVFVGDNTRGLGEAATTRLGPDALQVAGVALAKLVWSPVAAELGGCKRVYLSPDGALLFVPFAALPGVLPQTFVLDEYDLAYVATGRDLVHSGKPSKEPALLVGDPDYGATGEPAVTASPGSLLASRRSSGMEGYFATLPNTRSEVEAVAAMEQRAGKTPHVLLGKAATEEVVKAASHPSVLFLATHGFVLPPEAARPAPGTPTTGPVIGGERTGGVPDGGVSQARAVWLRFQEQGPMRRSGIALSGANDTLAGRRDSGGNDGILTAEEVIGMDLRGTRLVILSACESGVGDVEGGEGVYGLRRAFAIAGAQDLIMSLWSVDDQSTSRLMRETYARFIQGQSPQRALLAAQREYVAAERQAGHYPHPYFWAAFVASGSGAALEAGGGQ